VDFPAILDLPFAPDHPGDGPWLELLARRILDFPARPGASHCPRTRALAELNEALAHHPRAEELAARIRAFWSHTSAVRLLAETGLPDHASFPKEALQRLVDKVIPHLEHKADLYAWLDHLEASPEDALWLASLPEEVLAPWRALIQPGAESVGEAALLLAHRASGWGLSRDLLRIWPEGRDLDSPFAALPGTVRDVVLDPRQEAVWIRFREDLSRCEAALEGAHERLEASGVSTDLVFRMDLLAASLARIRTLLDFAHGRAPGRSLAVELVEGAATHHRLRPLLREGLRRLARKVVEHTGHSGEHYLVRDWREFWSMGRAAGGGGVLTAFTALFKFLLAGLGLAPGLGGMSLAANYAGSFIAMQFAHFSLASKQPAATAAALSAVLERSDGMEAEVEVIAAITRGQAMATLANLLATIPAALLLDAFWRLLSGHAFLHADKAAKTLESLHPLHSWTIPFAALTGVMLWLGSLAGGWASNWSRYRALPEAVAGSRRFQRFLGIRGAASLGRGLDRHLPGIITCIALGLMMGFLPMVLAFGGLPVEVRHVTLSAASAALAMGPGLAAGAVPWGAVAWAILGVVLIGLLNFGVSFALSLRLAIQARGLEARGRRELLKALGKAFLRKPGRFLMPG
jgi:site-specific recombinase